MELLKETSMQIVYIQDSNTKLYMCYDSMTKDVYFRPFKCHSVLSFDSVTKALDFLKSLENVDLKSENLKLEVFQRSTYLQVPQNINMIFTFKKESFDDSSNS